MTLISDFPDLASSSVPAGYGILTRVLGIPHGEAMGAKIRSAYSSQRAVAGSGPLSHAWDDEDGELSAIVSDARFPKESALFDQAETSHYVHVVTGGMVRLHRSFADGRRLVLGFALPGDFIGFSMSGKYTCSANAIGPVSTCRMSRAAFLHRVNSKPHLMHNLHVAIAQELELAHEQMMLLGRCTARERTAGFLINLRKRWKDLNGEAMFIALPMTRGDIGDFIGLTVETVSRMLSAFARQNLIEIVADGVRILDLRRLTAIIAT